MKIKVFLLVIFSVIVINAQSLITLGNGTALEIGAGADVCADSITGNGQLAGSGTVCGNPTDVETENEFSLPKEFELAQNYPNPFNPSTIIEYQLPKGSNISLKIYDILGNEVVTLVNEYKDAGIYAVKFNALSISSGIYFYKLQADNKTFIRKMSVIK
ncbi:MAG TPA: T9SS type A sorting domain-containing protein [Ignavibacteriaceae bacterium]|nr:T9SS type A sorting domain-containing protein [Ignavibacterium sp.]HMN18687.1 T9SS type A sorting domain-containing protein [Ignavibacteriaceae bacterium]